MDNKKQIASVATIIVLVIATIALLWWSRRPIVVEDSASMAPKKERKLPATLLQDPRFQELRLRGASLDIGTKGNPNPFEPFMIKQ